MSMGFLAVTSRQRVRWDAALIFGTGTGLCTDEAGMLLGRIPYNSPLSLLLIACVGVALSVGTINAALRDGTLEFKRLDRADILTEVSILLVMAGFLSRPASDHFGGGSGSCFLGRCSSSYQRLWKEALS